LQWAINTSFLNLISAVASKFKQIFYYPYGIETKDSVYIISVAI